MTAVWTVWTRLLWYDCSVDKMTAVDSVGKTVVV